MTHRYPANLDLRQRRCLVVGGGTVATRKVEGLLAAGARVTVVAPALTERLVALAEAGEVVHVPRSYRDSDLVPPVEQRSSTSGGRWWFVVAATDDPETNAAVQADAEREATWVNVASADDGGPAALPAVHRDGRLTVAVDTGGVHPAAAAWLRDLAAASLGPEHAQLLDLLAEVRSGRSARRPSWQTVLDSGTLDLIREGRVAEAKERLEACLS